MVAWRFRLYRGDIFKVQTRVETKTVFSFSRKAKIKRKWTNFREISFRENFRFCESFREKFSFSRKFSRKCSKTNIFAQVFFFCEILQRKFYFLTSILVHVYGYCLICYETLSGFDHPVGYLYIVDIWYSRFIVDSTIKRLSHLFWSRTRIC
jgi:hypothetical protein